MSERAAESGHWYRKDGTPAYTIIGKNGKERPTTLRDARKEGLVPSVTEIMKVAAKPGLTNWIIDQHIMAVLTMPRVEGESEAEYIARIKRDAGAQAEKARERGTQIHALVQQGFGNAAQDPFYDERFFMSVAVTLMQECGEQSWIVEHPFATPRYGGKVDLHNDFYLIDIKTTDKDLAGLSLWPEHFQQLAAYDNGLPPLDVMRKCGILYINVNTAESRLVWIDFMDYDRGWKCFNALLDYWYAKSGLEAV